MRPSTRYVYDPEGKLMKDPDESVVAAIDLVFQQFRLLGTAFKVMRYFAQHQIPYLAFNSRKTSESSTISIKLAM